MPMACPSRLLACREWDSRHLGLAVVEISRRRLPVALLVAVLQQARRQGVHLLYWPASPRQEVPPCVLQEFAGIRAARQVTFRKDICASRNERDAEPPPGIWIRVHPKDVASPPLVELAMTAGVCSRFRVDPRIPADKFRSLYEAWIQRSTSHEIADAVLVAFPFGDAANILGMVTVRVADGVGRIGLVTVAPSVRRQGLGRSLLQAAHRHMRERGAVYSRVATQRANRAACALYEHVGYEIAHVTNIFHFWPQEHPA
jgi:dTDP-4-amino-4,6-dideoxy-D-galactose acyltransferase